MYVCMYARTYVCMYVCMYVHTYVYIYVCMYVLTYIHTYIKKFVTTFCHTKIFFYVDKVLYFLSSVSQVVHIAIQLLYSAILSSRIIFMNQ